MNHDWKITFNAPVTLGFVGLCIGAFILNILTNGISNEMLFETYHSSLFSVLTWTRFFTHALGHSSISHLVGNMSYILLLGPLLEEKYGGETLIKIMIITAGITGATNYILFPNTALLGASGIVFAFILLSSITSIKEGEIPLTFILVALIYLGQQVYDALFVVDNIANFAHIIGGIVGAYFGFILNK